MNSKHISQKYVWVLVKHRQTSVAIMANVSCGGRAVVYILKCLNSTLVCA